MGTTSIDQSVPEGYQLACEHSAIPVRGKKRLQISGRNVLIVACEGELYAVEDRCPQTGRSIAHGAVIGGVLTTPTVGARYDLRTGQYIGGGQSPLQSHWLTVFPLRVIGDWVYIRLP